MTGSKFSSLQIGSVFVLGLCLCMYNENLVGFFFVRDGEPNFVQSLKSDVSRLDQIVSGGGLKLHSLVRHASRDLFSKHPSWFSFELRYL